MCVCVCVCVCVRACVRACARGHVCALIFVHVSKANPFPSCLRSVETRGKNLHFGNDFECYMSGTVRWQTSVVKCWTC